MTINYMNVNAGYPFNYLAEDADGWVYGGNVHNFEDATREACKRWANKNERAKLFKEAKPESRAEFIAWCRFYGHMGTKETARILSQETKRIREFYAHHCGNHSK